MQPRNGEGRQQQGFTVVELVIVIVVVAILSVYLAQRAYTPGEATLVSQAERLARDIRHMQMLAITWGKSLRLTVTTGVNGSYNVRCVTAGVAPCDVIPVIDPATGLGFSVSLQNNAVLAVAAGPNPRDFDSMGRPVEAGAVTATSSSYTLTVGTSVATVTVSPVSGLVSVTP